jgi:hypothetical protein
MNLSVYKDYFLKRRWQIDLGNREMSTLQYALKS